MARAWIIGVGLGVMLVIILFQWWFIVRLKRDALSRRDLLSEERQYLEQLLDRAEDDQIRELLRHRASLLGRLMIGEIAGDSRGHDAVVEEIAKLVSERDAFMHQNRLLFERWQPEMTAHLRDAGLDDREISICCLYALGLNGKMIQQYTQDGRHYQNVGLIRRKLGLDEHDRNIDGYIRSLMK